MPVSLNARMNMKLFSQVEQKVPYGRVSQYLLELVRKDLEREENHD